MESTDSVEGENVKTWHAGVTTADVENCFNIPRKLISLLACELQVEEDEVVNINDGMGYQKERY
jgi:hypothetical protein